MRFSRIAVAALILCAAVGLGFSQSIELVGAGATFPAPFYSKVFDEYNKQFNVKVNYQAIGSGGGQTQLKNKTVDFGASDVVVTEDAVKSFPLAFVSIPMVAGATVVTYNLPGSPELKLTSDIVADIFLGKIKKWNDGRIAALNASVTLPNTAITVVHRSDGSGTTAVFSDYLAKVSDEWKTKVGVGQSLNWPAGVGGKGNPGVAGLVKQLPGSVGYVELIYALQNNMPFAQLKNKSGNFIKASLASTSEAANVTIPDDVTKVNLTDSEAANGYPISTFTWILVYREQNYDNRPKAKVEAMMKLLWWVTHDGQQYAESLSYAKLPKAVVDKAEVILRSVTYDGAPVLK
ncbi:MAG: phosphate ABC transporter substrate-binding protein PstS [Spirochaetia bacterium]|jgi:phosphate transport system substrate-binding protein